MIIFFILLHFFTFNGRGRRTAP